MANHTVETQWMGKMQFNALVQGHTVVMDAPERVGGEDLGPIPKPFVLTALTGCTGMDVIALLRKQQIELQDMEIEATGELTAQLPIAYTSIELTYKIKGDYSHKDQALKAITDSQEKYCGVSFMLKKIMPVDWNVYYNQEMIYSTKAKELKHLVA